VKAILIYIIHISGLGEYSNNAKITKLKPNEFNDHTTFAKPNQPKTQLVAPKIP
jgi:hypothetical protein